MEEGWSSSSQGLGQRIVVCGVLLYLRFVESLRVPAMADSADTRVVAQDGRARGRQSAALVPAIHLCTSSSWLVTRTRDNVAWLHARSCRPGVFDDRGDLARGTLKRLADIPTRRVPPRYYYIPTRRRRATRDSGALTRQPPRRGGIGSRPRGYALRSMHTSRLTHSMA